MPPRTASIASHHQDHLSDLTAQRYARGGSDEEEKRAVEQHITACSACLLKLRIALRTSG